MKVQELKQNLLLQEWAAQIKAREESGMTVKQWCAENGPCLKTYYYRQKRVREELLNAASRSGYDLMDTSEASQKGREAHTQLVPSGFAEVRLTEPLPLSHPVSVGNSHLSIESMGVRLTASSEYPAEKLALLLREMRRPC